MTIEQWLGLFVMDDRKMPFDIATFNPEVIVIKPNINQPDKVSFIMYATVALAAQRTIKWSMELDVPKWMTVIDTHTNRKTVFSPACAEAFRTLLTIERMLDENSSNRSDAARLSNWLAEMLFT